MFTSMYKSVSRNKQGLICARTGPRSLRVGVISDQPKKYLEETRTSCALGVATLKYGDWPIHSATVTRL